MNMEERIGKEKKGASVVVLKGLNAVFFEVSLMERMKYRYKITAKCMGMEWMIKVIRKMIQVIYL